ncbi:hypothetical protein NM208_g12954 [Fusarium decemcellulare]|uniref:Uncharacterized protein n=1 Tax=Fusarium decemcellulare TaxID=57161 RepID=A0ACC1RR07_9HYPO|nr:hypothetical protein NM208_g12954 [Fusarium decemcellulare]
MASYKNWTGELGELCDALGIERTGPINCFVRNEASQPTCRIIPQSKRPKIDVILRKILANAGNEETVQELLLQLAEPLRCYKTHHKERVEVEGRSYDVLDYVASRLNVALRTWHQDRIRSNENKHRDSNISGPEHSAQHHTPAKAGTQILELPPEENQDKPGDDNHSDDGLTEGTRVEWKRASLQRPQLKREEPMMDETAFITPTKQRDSSNRMPSAGFQLTENQLTAGFAACNLTENLLIASPDSVASPNPSDIFSPNSAASTPMSIKDDFEPDPPVQRRRQSYLKRAEEESPTRRVSFRKLLDDMRELRITDEAPEARNRSSQTSLNVPYIRGRNVLDGVVPCEKDLKAKEPIIADVFDTISHKKKRPMVFLNKTPKHTVHDILEFMREPTKGQSLDPGYIYCFAEKSAPGYLKIGHIRSLKIHDENSGIVLQPEEEKNEDTVKKRLKEWGQKCGHDIDYKFRAFMPCAVWKMESYIHMTLHEEKRVARCPKIGCTTYHKEWFKITEVEARRTVEAWQKFSELKPYNKQGQVEAYWFSYATENSNRYLYKGGNTKRWLEGPWARETNKATVEAEKLRKEEIELKEEKEEAEREVARLLAQQKVQELEKRIESNRRKQRALGVNLDG